MLLMLRSYLQGAPDLRMHALDASPLTCPWSFESAFDISSLTPAHFWCYALFYFPEAVWEALDATLLTFSWNFQHSLDATLLAFWNTPASSWCYSTTLLALRSQLPLGLSNTLLMLGTWLQHALDSTPPTVSWRIHALDASLMDCPWNFKSAFDATLLAPTHFWCYILFLLLKQSSKLLMLNS